MSINPNLFIHPTDKAAMQALKAIPGFSQFIKAYMNIWNERQFRIMNMSSKLRISEKQMKKYYDLLPPICEKLGIPVPELYLELDVNPNAYTYGDTKPFIVITSGLFETLPDELIPTVLAHECGHIACHHTMYTTMGRLVLSGAVFAQGLASLITIPMQIAFAYWMRCSEFSADRAAMIYDGSPDKMIKVCMRFAGYDKDIEGEASTEAFMEQAEEYRAMVTDSKWNKTLEFLMYNQNDHPLNAVRAYECRDWAESEQYQKIINYLSIGKTDELFIREIPVEKEKTEWIGLNYQEAISILKEVGFHNITAERVMTSEKTFKDFQLVDISINGDSQFGFGAWYPDDAEIKVIYFEAQTLEEAIIAHQGKIPVPDSSKKYVGRHYVEVVQELTDAGFTSVTAEPQETRKTIFTRDNAIVRVTIAGQGQFEKGDWFAPDSIVRVSYSQII